jgi:hypothetical protein
VPMAVFGNHATAVAVHAHILFFGRYVGGGALKFLYMDGTALVLPAPPPSLLPVAVSTNAVLPVGTRAVASTPILP